MSRLSHVCPCFGIVELLQICAFVLVSELRRPVCCSKWCIFAFSLLPFCRSSRSVIQEHLLRRWRPRDGVAVSLLERRSRYMVTVLWIMAALLIAVFVPDISKVISVIGGISTFFIFIFPGEE